MRQIAPREELAQKQALIARIQNAPLDELIDWSLETYHSEENKARQTSQNPRKFIIYVGRTVYGKLLGFTSQEFFEDAHKSVAAQLREKLFVHHVLEEDTPFQLNVGVDLGTALEATLFGLGYRYQTVADPTYLQSGTLKSVTDYKNLALPDFYKAGWMPEAHRLYQEIQAISKDRLDVYFPGWARGPWSMATIVRGFNNAFTDYITAPQELADMLLFFADARIHFERQRCKFLGISPQDTSHRWTYCSYRYNHNSDLFEDEVDGSLFSKEMNRDIILPAQQRLSDFYGGIAYYHSCGKLTGFIPDIMTLHIQKYQHISPLSFEAFETFDRLLAPEVIAQVSLPSAEVASVREAAEMERILSQKLAVSTGRNMEICADALFEGGWPLIENLLAWRNAFRRLTQGQS